MSQPPPPSSTPRAKWFQHTRFKSKPIIPLIALPQSQSHPTPPLPIDHHNHHYPSIFNRILTRKTILLLLLPCALLTVFLAGKLQTSSSRYELDLDFFVRSRWRRPPQTYQELIEEDDGDVREDEYDPLRYLKGPPTASFQDNLLPNMTYITGFVSAGYTNDFMTLIHQIWLGQMTQRIPIIPPFIPSHIGYDEVSIPFGDLFDVPRAARGLHMPLLEWRDVKLKVDDKPEVDDLGCWTVWAGQGDSGGKPRWSSLQPRLGLDVSHTRVPDWCELRWKDNYMDAWGLAALNSPSWYDQGLKQNSPMESQGAAKHHLPPSKHLMCFDFLYYLSVNLPWEWDEDYSPQWQVAKHFRWSEGMMEIANGFLMRLFEVKTEDEIPPFISIHVRHGDFRNICDKSIKVEDCFAPLSVIARRVQEVQDELREKYPGITDYQGLPVLMTSDERDPEWWLEVKALGWLYVDHGEHGENTVARFGKWYPVLLDSAFQSMGKGFVGTKGSTMSVVARRRVEDWHGGAWRYFEWGRPGADNH